MAYITAPISDDDYGDHPVRPVPPDYSRGEITAAEYLPIGGWMPYVRWLERKKSELEERVRELEKKR